MVLFGFVLHNRLFVGWAFLRQAQDRLSPDLFRVGFVCTIDLQVAGRLGELALLRTIRSGQLALFVQLAPGLAAREGCPVAGLCPIRNPQSSNRLCFAEARRLYYSP